MNLSMFRWLVLCMGKLWESFEEAKWAAVREGAIERLCSLLTDPVPEVTPIGNELLFNSNKQRYEQLLFLLCELLLVVLKEMNKELTLN